MRFFVRKSVDTSEGMLDLVDQRAGHAGRKGHVYPAAVAEYMWYVKQLYPPIHACEIVRIVARKFGYKTNHHTVKRFFERYPGVCSGCVRKPVIAPSVQKSDLLG